MSTSSVERLSPLEAYALLSEFVTTRGRDALLLACHAAVLERMRPDVIALMRANFLEGPAQANAALDAHVLFGPLSSELGGGYFRMDQEVRRQAIRLLDTVGRQRGEPALRSQRVARLVIRYVEDRRAALEARHDSPFQQYLNENSWMAQALLDPERAIAALFVHMNRVSAWYASGSIDRSEVRFGGLAAILEVPVPSFVAALDRARAIDAISDRDYATANRLLADLDRTRFSAGGVELAPLAPMLARLETLLAAPDSTTPASESVAAPALKAGPSAAEMEAAPAPRAGRVDGPLHQAAMAGDRAALESILDRAEAAIDAQGLEGKLALHLVAERDRADLVTLLLDRGAPIDTVDDAGRTALFVAALNGRTAVAAALLARGAAVDARKDTGETPLMAAAANGHDATLDLLLAHGADVNAVDHNGAAALGWAAYSQRRRAAWRLLEQPGLNVLGRTAQGSATTHHAAIGRLTDVVLEVAARGAAIDKARADGWTPLLIACWSDDVATAEVLLELGADPRQPFPGGRTSLHFAAELGGAALIHLLERFGADPRALLPPWGYLPIHLAAGWGRVEALDALARLAPDTLTQAGSQRTALHVACEQGRPEAVTVLLAYPQVTPRLEGPKASTLSLAVTSKSVETVRRLLAHPELPIGGDLDPDGEAPLQRAVRLGLVEIVRAIATDPRARPALADDKGIGLLHLAAESGHAAVIDLLIELGMSVDTERAGDTPLTLALAKQHANAVSALLRAGADPNRPVGSSKRTPMTVAIEHTFDEGVRQLNAAGADLRPPLLGDDTLLHLAARAGATGCLGLLLEAGLEVEARNARGETPLHVAVRSIDAIATLLAHGADLQARDQDGETPLYRTLSRGRQQAFEAFVAAGAARGPVVDRYGWTPLHVAAQYGDSHALQRALAVWPDSVNAVSSDPALTPLQAAVESGAADAVGVLLAAGADTLAITRDRKVPFYIAWDRGDRDTMARLNGLAGWPVDGRVPAPPLSSNWYGPREPNTAVSAASPIRSAETGLFPLLMGTSVARLPLVSPWRPTRIPRAAIVERDRATCGFCGFVSAKYHDVVVSTARPRDLSRATLACIMCQAVLFLDLAPEMKNAVMIWLPGVRQDALNALARAIYVGRISQGVRAEEVRQVLDLLMARREPVRERLGTDNPIQFARQLAAARDETEVAALRTAFAGVRVLPLDRRIIKEDDLEFNQFPQILAFWRSKDGPFGRLAPPQWSPTTFADMLSSCLDPSTLDLSPNWLPTHASHDTP